MSNYEYVRELFGWSHEEVTAILEMEKVTTPTCEIHGILKRTLKQVRKYTTKTGAQRVYFYDFCPTCLYEKRLYAMKRKEKHNA